MNTLIGIPSPHGSAEVLGRGTNSYTDIWSHTAGITALAAAWDRWDEFPTVVRVGNFVYCAVSIRTSTPYYISYKLIDIVPDPEEPNRLGRNVAYPYITQTTDSVERVLTGYNTIATVSETNFVLDFENKQSKSHATAAGNVDTYGGYFNPVYSTFEKAILSFTDGSISSARISRTSYAARATELTGYSGINHLLKADGSYTTDTTQFLFAPVANRNQFNTLYGKESDWSRPSTASYKWLFESNDTTYPLIQFGETALPTYPFTIQTPTSNTEFGYSDTDEVEERTDIEVGDGPDLADVLKGAAIGTAIACNKDLINKAVEKAKAELKNMASTVMEAGSTALLELQEKADGVKADLVAKLPEIPEKITNVHDAITSLDLADLGAVQAFKEKYGDLVDDIDGLLSKFKLPDFDICSLLSISHEKSAAPESPTTAPLEPARNNSVPQVGASQPISNDSGLTKENAEEASRNIDQAWKRVEAADSGDGGKAYLAEAVNARRREIMEDAAPIAKLADGREYYTVDAFYSVTDLKTLEPEEPVGSSSTVGWSEEANTPGDAELRDKEKAAAAENKEVAKVSEWLKSME